MDSMGSIGSSVLGSQSLGTLMGSKVLKQVGSVWVLSSRYWVLGWGLMLCGTWAHKRVSERVRCRILHPSPCGMGESGQAAREAARKQQEAKQDGIATERQHNLSKEQAKQDQTTTTASEPSKPLPQCEQMGAGMDD